MKKLIFGICLFFNLFSYSQDLPKLKLTPNGVEGIVVVTDSLKASDIYKKSLNWVQETYKNPDKVIKAKIENEKIRIDGFSNNAWWYKALGVKYSYDMEYTIEISIKDGKYKFDYTIGEFFTNGQKGGYDFTAFFKKTGEVRSVYADAVPSIEETMNSLSLSLYEYVLGKNKKNDDKW